MKKIKIFMISFFILNSAHCQLNRPTTDLHRYLITLDRVFSFFGHKEEIDLGKIKNFVLKGADVNALSDTGANAIHSLVEAWSGFSGSEKDENEFLKCMEFLLQLDSDPSTIDYRGNSPLWYALNFKFDKESRSRGVDLLLSYHANLNLQPDSYYVSSVLLTISSDTEYSLSEINKYLDAGLDLTAVGDAGGFAFSHFAAKLNLVDGEKVTRLEFLLNNLNSEDQYKLSRIKSKNGMTPLHFAVIGNNFLNVKYLIENHRVDHSPVSRNNKTPLDLAIELDFKEISRFLESKKAIRFSRLTGISCTEVNSFKVSYEKIKRLIETCELTDIESLLKLIPPDYLSNNILSYFTHAVQGASKEFPHVTTFGSDGKTMLAFNGSEKQRGFYNLEVLEFSDETKEFELRDITFPKNGKGKVHFSQKNPTRCLGCHGNKPRPLWDSWTSWPGKYGSEVDVLLPKEKEYYQEFLPHRQKGRYKYLPPSSSDPFVTPFGYESQIWFSQVFQNQKLDKIIMGLMGQKIAQEIIVSNTLSSFKYAFLSAVSCRDKIEDYTKGFEDLFIMLPLFLEKDTLVKSKRLQRNKMNLLERLLGQKAQSRFVSQQRIMQDMELTSFSGDNFFIDRVARLRYLAENLGYDMSNWFTPYNNGLESYSMDIRFTALEHELWENFMANETDKKLLALYQEILSRGNSNVTGLKKRYLFLYSDKEDEVCAQLKKLTTSSL